MKTCGHVSSRDKKKQAGSYFVMQAGLRNNEFCLHGLILDCERVLNLLYLCLPVAVQILHGMTEVGKRVNQVALDSQAY